MRISGLTNAPRGSSGPRARSRRRRSATATQPRRYTSGTHRMIAAAGRPGPRPYRVAYVRVVCGGQGRRSRVGSRRRGANGSTLRRDPVGRESPARDAQRERDAEPRRLRVRLQAHRTTGLQGTD